MEISIRQKGRKLSETHINSIVKAMKIESTTYTKDGVLMEFVNFKSEN